MRSTSDQWDASTWSRPTDGIDGGRFNLYGLRSLLRDALDEASDLPDDAPGPTIGDLREWWSRTAVESDRGAEIVNPAGSAIYRVTLDPRPGSAELRTVEVIATGDNTDPSIFRVPVGTLAAQARAVLALPADIVIGARGPARPTAETLAEHARDRIPRSKIAERYDRKVATVDQWMREARRERPDLDWPERRRGPSPRAQTPPATAGENRGESPTNRKADR
ncbi:hypothetical protein CQ047_16050 [Microbacterium sp. MYb72]|uniref:hypothetical protein n=1 Tax=Microbacterium sp. MYb72 TaxID=1848693 RepID=UPI000CFB564D|nr:hypothetical protein [Microbacterium sp. MYb72]PRB04970.1 hypothetical protein CQ047_16050 [Microbacterium sp. MYb72]